jgi:hypothetical protein
LEAGGALPALLDASPKAVNSTGGCFNILAA